MEVPAGTIVQPDLPHSPVDQQLEQLDAAVRQIQRVRAQLEESEAQFKRITEQCGGALEALVKVDEQHVTMVAALNERLNRLVEQSAERLQRFERGVGHEWTVLRALYEQPLGALRQQANELQATCYEVARSASLTSRIAEASFTQFAPGSDGDVARQQARSRSTPWSLAEVAQLHHEMRGAPDATGPDRVPYAAVADVASAAVEPAQPAGKRRVSGRMLWWIAALVTLLLISGGLAAYSVRLRDRVGRLESQAADATRRIGAAEQRVVETLRNSDEKVAQAEQAARQASIVSDILAAPDVRRIDLLGDAAAPAAFAQAVWSRSRGCVLSAAGLPAPPPGRAYHLWVLSAADPASLGTLEYDASGRAKLVVDSPLRFSRLRGLVVSDEPVEGSRRPTGAVYLRTRP